MLLGFSGDLILQELSKPEEVLFGKFKDVIQKNGINLILNLESPFVYDSLKPVKNKITLHADSSGVNYVKYLSPYLVNIANNHINDYGNPSVEYTFSLLQQSEIPYFGAGLSNDLFNVNVDDVNEIVNIAYCTRDSDFTNSKLFAETDFFGVKNVDFEQIKALKEKYSGYKIIVNIHWGIENIIYPEINRILLGRKLIDAGVDLVIGHHPHIIQPYEKYKDKYIFYSIGNFYFNDITFLSGKENRIKRSLKHQRKGIIPVFRIESGNLSLFEIYQVNIKSDDSLDIEVSKQSVSHLLSSGGVYRALHGVYLFLLKIKHRLYPIKLKLKRKFKI